MPTRLSRPNSRRSLTPPRVCPRGPSISSPRGSLGSAIKFHDLDGDGKQGTGEPGLANWVIEVKDANGNIVGYAVTDANRRYCVVVPSPGTYTVSEQQQAGWVQTAPPSPGTYTVTVPPAHTNLNFGNQEKKDGKAEICVFKFEDLDGDGVKDPNELLLGGWQFTVSPAPLPPTTSPVTTLPSGGICFGVAAPGTYTISETLQPGWIQTFPPAPGTYTVTVPPSVTNINFGNRRREEGKCDLQIRKSVSPNPANSGQPITVTLTVTNVGNGPCGPDTVVQDPATPGLSVPPQTVSVGQSGGTAMWGCLILGGGVNCVTSSTLPPGYSATFTFTATPTVASPPGSSANIQNCATVNNPNDPLNPMNPGNNQSCVTITVRGVGVPIDLTLAKLLDGTLRAEQEATYVLRITNVGGTPTTSTIRVVDPLPPQLRFISATGMGWSCSASGQNVSCTSAGPLAPNQTSTIVLRVRVAAPAGTQITNCATVETAGDANPANNRGCHTGTVQR